MTSPRPFVSVIIPVFNDAAGLLSCLASLREQSYPRERYEIVVVDNGSEEDLQGLVAGRDQTHLVRESQPGSYAARNRGIAAAKGEILAFTDSDCIPDREWIEKGVASLLECPDCGFVAGRIEMFFRDPTRPTAPELYDFIVMNFHQDRNIQDRRFGATANLFAFKRVFDSVGLFDGRLFSGGDLEWGRRVLGHGLRQVYAADARVAHPARHSLRETFDRAARLVGGASRQKLEDGSSPGFIRQLARSVTPALPFYWRILRDRRLPRLEHRARVVLVAVGVKYVGAWELVRLKLGGRPRR